jgi:hypothetical protein
MQADTTIATRIFGNSDPLNRVEYEVKDRMNGGSSAIRLCLPSSARRKNNKSKSLASKPSQMASLSHPKGQRCLAELKASGAEGASHLQLGTAAVGVGSIRVISASDRPHIGRALGLRLVKRGKATAKNKRFYIVPDLKLDALGGPIDIQAVGENLRTA